jgi:hypothetical protein
MDINYKRESVIYICFVILLILILFYIPIYSLKIFQGDSIYAQYKDYFEMFSSLVVFIIIGLIFSMIIVSIFI